MAVCPKCQTELDAEFGMTQCPSCGAFSFVGDDGVARAPEDEAPPIESVAKPAPADNAVNADLGFAPFDANSDFGSGGPAGFEPVPFETPEVSVEPPAAFDPAPENVIDVAGEGEPQAVGDMAGGFGFEAPSAFDMPSGFDASSPESPMESLGMASFQTPEPSEPERPAMAFGPASDPLNLNEFANSEVSSGRNGPLLFRLFLTGIDTKEIRESIREVLNDDRLRLEASTILSQVSKGNLVIDGLSPVKASILVNRIKRLPITIRWEQYAITEANP